MQFVHKDHDRRIDHMLGSMPNARLLLTAGSRAAEPLSSANTLHAIGSTTAFSAHTATPVHAAACDHTQQWCNIGISTSGINIEDNCHGVTPASEKYIPYRWCCRPLAPGCVKWCSIWNVLHSQTKTTSCTIPHLTAYARGHTTCSWHTRCSTHTCHRPLACN